MLGPALLYLAFNWGDSDAMRGWAIPTATDIAFALGTLAILGPRVPASLKVFLLALAIIDDLAAIVIIALFYTADLSLLALALAGVGLAALVVLNLAGIARRACYVLVGVFLWVCVLKSGVHATLAGVLVGFAIPLHAEGQESPLRSLEHDLHPWVTFLILPAFAFANAGVRFADFPLSSLLHPVQLGVETGLLLGKPLGVVGAVWVFVRLGLAPLPEGTSWQHIVGVGLLTGIGFTMSLFIGSLAFPAEGYNVDVRVGVLLASVLAAGSGYVVLRAASPRPVLSSKAPASRLVPDSRLSVVIAGIVLGPEAASTVRAGARIRLQASIDLVLGRPRVSSEIAVRWLDVACSDGSRPTATPSRKAWRMTRKVEARHNYRRLATGVVVMWCALLVLAGSGAGG